MLQFKIDNTLLKPLGPDRIKGFIMDTYKFGFRGLVIDDCYYHQALEFKKHFPSTPTKLIQVLNFPMGNKSMEQIFSGIQFYSDEYDIVLPLYEMKGSGRIYYKFFYKIFNNDYIGNKTVKFIIEENLWTRTEIEKYVKGIYDFVIADKIENEIYIKSNTGFRGYRLLDERLELIELVKRISKGRFKTKIAGGIKTYVEARKVISAGGIIGTSNGLGILEWEQKEARVRKALGLKEI